jgi:hypothetical protein
VYEWARGKRWASRPSRKTLRISERGFRGGSRRDSRDGRNTGLGRRWSFKSGSPDHTYKTPSSAGLPTGTRLPRSLRRRELEDQLRGPCRGESLVIGAVWQLMHPKLGAGGASPSHRTPRGSRRCTSHAVALELRHPRKQCARGTLAVPGLHQPGITAGGRRHSRGACVVLGSIGQWRLMLFGRPRPRPGRALSSSISRHS